MWFRNFFIYLRMELKQGIKRCFFMRKPFLLPEPQFFLIFIFLFSLILYLIRFNPNNESHFLDDGNRKEFQI